MRKLRTTILLGLLLFGVASMFVTLPTPSASGEVPWKGKDRSWYYDNLDTADRKIIRQAVDYCIPREQIIEGLHLGYAEAITSPIGVNFVGVYEASIAARVYNTTKALELLTDVFEYEYDAYGVVTNDTTMVTIEPYFSITLVAPTTNTARSQWAALISFSLNTVGIDTIIKWWNWDIIMPRLFLDPTGIGYDYEHGGYDMFFIGYDATPDPTYKEMYDKNTFPPSSNCYWVEDGPATSGLWTPAAYPNVTALWTDIYKEMDPNTRTVMLKEYQQWCYDNVPTAVIRQEIQIFAMDIDLEGFDLLHGIQTMIGNWSGIGTSAAIAQPGDYVDFNPQMSNSYYDAIIFENTHVRLSRRRGEYNISHAVPWFAESWNHSADYLTWTVELRENNYWSDGTLITADDVVYSYHTTLNASLAAPGRGTLMNILGNATGTDGTYSSVQKGANDYQVIFTLPEVYAYVETVLFGLDILQKAQMDPIGLGNWKTHGTNTGAIPMVAGGQYVMHDYDGTDTVELWVNPYYNETAMGHDPNAVGGGNWIPEPTITDISFEVVKSGTIAVAGITSGTYDVIDSQMGIQADAQTVNNSANSKIMLGYEWGYQEMGLNHMNPIFGMNAKDPRILYTIGDTGLLPDGNYSKTSNDAFNSLLSISTLLISNPILFIAFLGTTFGFGAIIAKIVEITKK